MVGRSAELRAIAGLLEKPQEGMRGLLLEGEAGIGKTSLWNAARSASTGYRLLSSAPTEAETGLPYAVLGDLLDTISEDALASLSGPLRSALEAALFRAPPKQAATDQLAVSTAFLRVLRHLAADNPLVLALDDVQWIDGPSMRVLAFALHRLEHEPIRVLAALRLPTTSGAGAELQKALGQSRLARLQIGPLSRSDIDDLLLSRLERPLRLPEFDQVYAVSGGNPFFALEIGRFILDHPASVRAGEPIPVPHSLGDVIQSRIEKLPRDTRDILVPLAALSRPDEALIQRADARASAALGPAIAAGVVEHANGRLHFTHPLLASVIYGSADPSVRRRWHARLAELVSDSEEKARHLALSASGPDDAVADALEDAARSANARGAPDAAAALAQQASDLTPSERRPAIDRRRIMTAEYRLRAGDAPAARAILEALLRASPIGSRPAEALRLLASITFSSGDLREAELLLIEALSEVGADVHTQAIIERDLILALNQQGKWQEAFDASVRFSELAARTGDPMLLASAQRNKAFTARHFNPLSAEARAIAVGLAEGTVAMPIDDRIGGLHPLMDWAVLLKFADDFEHSRTLFKRALSMSDGRDESVRAPILFHLAEIECWTGDWLLAAVYARECEKSVAHAAQRSYSRLSLTASAMLHCCLGEHEAARSDAIEALAISAEIGDEPYRRRALAILGSNELSAGDPAAANRHFEKLRARRTGPGFRGATRSEGDEVEALLALGELREAESVSARVAAEEEPWPRAVGRRCQALVLAARGELELSIKEFDEALSDHEQLPMPLERARTLFTYGTVLRRAKSKRVARERLEEALAIFKALGAMAWVKRAESELSRIAPAAAGVGALTPTEARIAALVALGRTNKEVAAELHLTAKTVEANLTRIYGKLQVRSRSELAARLPRQ